MSMRVVLDAETVKNWLRGNPQVIDTIVKVCDRIIVNDLVRKEYKHQGLKYESALLPELERVRESSAKTKVMLPNMAPLPEGINLPSEHKRLIEGAVRAKADLFVMHTGQRGRWISVAQTLNETCNLRILTPQEYVDERSPTVGR